MTKLELWCAAILTVTVSTVLIGTALLKEFRTNVELIEHLQMNQIYQAEQIYRLEGALETARDMGLHITITDGRILAVTESP